MQDFLKFKFSNDLRPENRIPELERVYRQAKELIEIEDLDKNSLIIDAGSSYGHVIRAIAPTGCQVYSFEAHPLFYGFLVRDYSDLENVVLSNKAVWCENEVRKFYFKESREDLNGGATLMSEKSNITNPGLGQDVECFDLSEFILNLDKDVDVLKIDIEGAEYEVLNKLFDTGAHERVKSIYLEDHERKMRSYRYKNLKQEVVKKFSSVNKDLNWW